MVESMPPEMMITASFIEDCLTTDLTDFTKLI